MIAAVNGWRAVLPALLFILPMAAPAADDLNGAARELARRTVVYAGRGDAISIAYHNVSSLTPAAMEQLRHGFEAALQEGGARLSDNGAVETRLTLSEDQTQYLLIEEVRKADDHQVWMASWRREAPIDRTRPRITLDRKRIWDQTEPILDAVLSDTGLLVLSSGQVSFYSKGADGQWQPNGTAAILPVKPWPRDLRGHLRVSAQNFQAFLPGMSCTGTVDALSSMICRAVDEPWLLESGARGILLANFAAGRNYFDGRVVTQAGTRKTVAAFYSAVAVEDQGRAFWLLALVDGRAQIVDASFETVGTFPGWGSDVAGVDAQCGSGSQFMATKAGDSNEPDAVQLFAFGNRVASPVAVPVTFSGPVTALWPLGGASVLAVERDLTTGRYAAYVLTVGCGG